MILDLSPDELIIDLFAGGGGASAGIEAAVRRHVDIGINHDRAALAVHEANHPQTHHIPADIWEVRPKALLAEERWRGRRIGLLWASPDCTHFSVAKGGKPRKQNIRSLAWVVTRWAKDVRPRMIYLENVSEFRTWGPLGPNGQPDKRRMGETFRRWLARLEKLGYAVEYRVLDASLYGAPTRRRRLFLIARCDGRPIRWPEPTHGPGKLPLHTAAECIDWSLACPSIFERKKPLADKTLWRIAQGIKRFVLENPKPFIVKFRGDAHSTSIDEPLHTITAGDGKTGGAPHAFGLAVPVIAGVGGRAGDSHPTGGDAPLGTITAKNDRALVMPSLVNLSHGGRVEPLDDPLLTVTATPKGGDRALVVPTLIEMNHSNAPHGVDEPLGVVTTQHNRFQLVDAHLEPAQSLCWFSPLVRPEDRLAYQMSTGEDLRCDDDAIVAPSVIKVNHGIDEKTGRREHSIQEPLTTITSSGNGHALIAPSLVKVNHGKHEPRGESIEEPLSTVTATQRGHALVAPTLIRTDMHRSNAECAYPPEDPLRTITSAGGFGLIAPTLIQTGYGERDGQRPRYLDIEQPLGTVVAGGAKHGVIAAHLSRQFGAGVGTDPAEPMNTVMPGGQGKTALVSAFLAEHYGGSVGHQPELPLSTITSAAHHGPVAATLVKLRGGCHGADLEEPAPTVTAKGTHIAEVRAFLTAYYTQDGTQGKGQSLLEPLRVVTTKARLGLVTVEGAEYQICDIGMRMLEPHELLWAQFGEEFAANYDLRPARTKAGMVRMIGNSVPPKVAKAIVAANVYIESEEAVA